MYPLLAAAGSQLASNLVDSLSAAMSRKLNPTAAAGAQKGTTATATAAAHQPTIEEQIAALKARLLNAPELQSMVQSADPTQGASLSISPVGVVTSTDAAGRTSTLTLSPETANMARQLGGMMSDNAGTSAGSFSLMAASRPTLRVYA